MDIEAIAKDHFEKWHGDSKVTVEDALIAALTELSAAHTIELRAYEATVANQAERIRQLEVALAESREQADRMLDAIYKLEPLARRVLWMAFVWNDHNFTHPLDYAIEEAKKAGLNCLDDAQEFLADVAMLAAAPEKEAGRVPVNAEENLSSMIIDWVDSGIKSGTDWRNGLQEVIGKRLKRLAAAPRRCHLCDYQHGHKIGCVNNPVDIALRAAAPAKEDSRHD